MQFSLILEMIDNQRVRKTVLKSIMKRGKKLCFCCIKAWI